jgi:Flp pilus assembly pilin Flp
MTLRARREEGQTTVEYAFLLVLIVLALIAGFTAFGVSTRQLYSGAVQALMP